jgi:serine/threonine protein phosphatase PrpC
MPTRLAIAARTDVGRVRAQNEDAFLISDLSTGPKDPGLGVIRFEVGARGALLALSDGMGGHANGEVASALSLSSFHNALTARMSIVDADARVKVAMETANRDVLEAAGTRSHSKMGATLSAILVQDDKAHIAQVGDSRAYLLRGGAIRQVTHDQSFVQMLLDTKVMSEEEAKSSPMKNVLMQALGQQPTIEVALGMLALRNRDCLLLCSDGLWGKLSPEEMRDAVLTSPTLDVACERMVHTANDRGGDDNITVVLAGCGGDLLGLATGERISDTFQVLTTFEPKVKR